MARPRVLLADDHHLLLGALEKLLAPECEIVGTASDGRSLVAEAQRLKPDVVILDIAMPLLNGLDAGRQIKQLRKSTKLVYVTMNEDPDLAAEAFRAGASAYLLKRSAASELLLAIREVMNGRSYVTPLVTEGLVGSFMDAANRKPSHDLTPRQREVLQLLAEGHSMKQVAALLNVTPRTVAFHKYRMMEQLNIRSNAELIQFAITHHIV
ncbi:MAG TPA: response regulator transcription factor [Vicinamibacterales bacterium]|nr:response regulator transcription factor [Vicinamibacterales bacterium]